MGATDRPDERRDPFLGRVIDGRFTIQSVLGRGGMGVVYQAHQASLERSVALKLMTGVPPERAEEFQRRFFLEAATAARLKHPNTITVFDYGSSVIDGENVFFITMELLEGVTLSKMLSRGRSLPPLRATHIALQICRSLREAHLAGVVHRDLKPGNVMILKQDEADDVDVDFVKVLDFGLAKTRAGESGRPLEGITKAGTFMGSPRYVAPEQIEGRAIDQRADIYSFGCMLYRMLSGRVPFDGQQPVEVMLKHLRAPVPALAVPGLPESLERLVTACLAKDAAERPSRMEEVVHRLKLARAELGGVGSGLIILSDDRRAAVADDLPSGPLRAADAGATLVVPPPLPSPHPSVRPRAAAAEAPGAAARGAPQRSVLPVAQARTANPASAVTAPGAGRTGESSSTGWVLGSSPMDDSTRSTRVLRTVGAGAAPPRPWAAIGSGVVIGLVICTGLVAWRLGFLELMWSAGARASDPPALASSRAGASPPALAQRARVRIETVPAGADVLEFVDGLPRLLGITPLTLDWDVPRAPRSRELVFRKEGHGPARATVEPPARGHAPEHPVWIDVRATLRPLGPEPLGPEPLGPELSAIGMHPR